MKKYKFRYYRNEAVLFERTFIAGSLTHAWQQAHYALESKEERGFVEISLIDIIENE